MATAVANVDGTIQQIQIAKPRRFVAKRDIRKDPISIRLRRAARVTAIYGVIFTALAGIALIAGFTYFYNHYEAIVEKRVKSGFWHSRAGIYAAPYRLMKDQKTSRDTVVDLLKLAGYVEGTGDAEIWNGSFTADGNTIEIRFNELFNPKNNLAQIKFSGNRIVQITDGKSKIDEFKIEPVMLTGRSETKRGESTVLKYNEIPEILRDAILMAEDQRFFEHNGIDPRGIARAFVKNFNEGTIKQGGSTITQQLVKNTFLSPEKSYSRKFREAFMSLALENKMSKEDIFALYCNEIYLGQYGTSGVHGVKQAANAYFDKELDQLDLNEAAAIAAMIKNPNRFAPHKNEADAKTRRDWIVGKMTESGNISREDADNALKAKLSLAQPKISDQTVAPYFVDAATRELTGKFQKDYLNTNFNTRIYTTIDTQLQALAEKSVDSHLAVLDKTYGKKGLKLQGVIVAIDPRNGHILAMVGGRNYADSQFNRAADAKRQPGSTFKPFVYAAALERGMTPTSLHADKPMEFSIVGGKPYKPENYGKSYTMESITMKTALAKSSNVVAVQTAFETGLRDVARKAGEFGFDEMQPYPSMALGAAEVTPLQLAAAYAAFANGGRQVQPTFIDSIVSGEEEILFESGPADKQIISERTAYMITDMLKAVVERGTASKEFGALGKDVTFAGKTGSSEDGWFVGYTPNLVTVAWIGTDDSSDLRSTGGEIALPLWVDFMKGVVQTRPELGGEAFPMPKGIEIVTVDPATGMIADSYCPMSETVAVSTTSVSHVRCILHQPLPEALALADPEAAMPVEIEPAAAAEIVPENDAGSERDFKEINGVPTPRDPSEKDMRDQQRELRNAPVKPSEQEAPKPGAGGMN